MNANPIITAAKSAGPRVPCNDLKPQINNGVRTIRGQALKKTTLQAPSIPVLSISLSGNQYSPQAAALKVSAMLSVVSE